MSEDFTAPAPLLDGFSQDASSSARPPRRRRRWGWVLAGILVLVLAVAGGLTLLPSRSGPAPARLVAMAEIPGYQAAVNATGAALERQRAELKSGRLFQFVPATRTGQDYIQEFLADLQTLQASGTVLAGSLDQDQAVLRRRLTAYTASVQDLEKKFRELAPLGLQGRAKDSVSGRTITFTGKSSPKGEVTRLEALSRGYAAEPDAAGSYIPSATALAGTFGLSVDWDIAKLSAACPSSNAPDQDLVAAFCSATPRVIYANRNTSAADYVFNSPVIVSAMKHELSHYLITLRCGTPDPRLAGTRFEAVTNSYAVIFLGAGFDDLQPRSDVPHQEYAMTADTDAIARKIHAGSCS
ncbi:MULTISPECIES: hypothetical protein [Arthrobacter]|uniref:Uncharacterized protein n=2 Tax=Arthrobacter TaxID=1663 RepID=A0ABU9KL92_9MICC|nr:hypothetical protein [Arthrobacter sp. YJM1]MDP5227662.1 hypothetical protein [Arthrobacter sp. YJM1]